MSKTILPFNSYTLLILALTHTTANALSLTIPQIQGSAGSSPYINQTVTTQGIITHKVSNGFYVQDAQGDNDSATSDGIFVYLGSRISSKLAIGDHVTISGTVGEYYQQTQISQAQVSVTASNNTISVTPISLPMSTTQWEQYEGMLISLNDLTVTDTYDLGRYGQITLAPTRLWHPLQINPPGTEAQATARQNNQQHVIMDDGHSTTWPTVVQFPGFGTLAHNNPIRAGQGLPNLQGVVDYSYGEYRVIPTHAVLFSDPTPRQQYTQPKNVGGTLKVASFNVLNYFTTLQNQGKLCGAYSNLTCRGADDADEFTRQQQKLIHALQSMQADIIALIEIENNTTASLQSLVNALNTLNALEQPSQQDYAYIDTGTMGTDAIKQGLLYRRQQVNPLGEPVIHTFPHAKNRPALIQRFQPLGYDSAQSSFTIAVNHFKSKGSDCDDLFYEVNGINTADIDQNDGQGNCNLTRLNAAKQLIAFLQDQQNQSTPDTDKILLLGDFNAWTQEDPIRHIKAAGYTDLIAEHEPNNWSYGYKGEWGTLDYAFANQAMANLVSGATIWHSNADEPAAFNYNLENKSTSQRSSYYAPDAFRASDHDPLIIGLDFSALNQNFTSNNNSLSETPTNTPNNNAQQSGAGCLGFLSFGLLTLLSLGWGWRRFNNRPDPD